MQLPAADHDEAIGVDADILDQLHVAVVCVDGAGRIVRFNRAAVRLFGFDASEVLGTPLGRLLPDHVRERHATWVHRFAEHGTTSRPMGTAGLIEGRRRDGRPFWALTSISRTTSGSRRLLTAALTDVTDQQIAVQERALLRDAISRSTAMTLLTCADGRVTHASRSLMACLGFDRDADATGWPLAALLGEATASELLHRVRSVGRWAASVMVDTSAGGGRELRGRASLIGNDAAATSISITFDDVTRLRRVEVELERVADHFARAEQLAHVGSWTWTIATGVITWTDEIYRIFGHDPGAVEPTYAAFLEQVHPDDREDVERAVDAAVASDVDYDIVHRVVRPDGEVRYVREAGEVERDDHGVPLLMRGTVQDVSEDVTKSRALEASVQLTRDVFDSLAASGVILDGDGAIVGVNRAWLRFTRSQQRGEVPGLGDPYDDRIFDVLQMDRADAEALRRGIARVVTGGEATFTIECEVGLRDRISWFEIRAQALGTAVGGAVVLHSEITARKVAEAELAHRASHDALTGLPNRDLLLRRTAAALRDLAERPGHVGVLFLDLDRFKAINDRFGHAVGDEVIRVAAQRLGGCVRATDTLCRFGGDEFVILLPWLEDPDETRILGERIIEMLRTPIVIAGKEFTLGASIGVATSNDPRCRAEDMLRDADAAMFRAKDAGRSRLVMHHEERRATELRRIDLEQSLHGAVRRGELDLYRQGQFDLSTGELVGFEALLRWRHPELGPVAPGEFVPIAESTGLIHQIGSWVLEKACFQAAGCVKDGCLPADGHVAVNVSTHQLSDPGFVSSVVQTLHATGLPPASLCLEITESALMDDFATSSQTLEQLRGLGVRISLDDFGTGHASLSYLARVPLDEIKIDRTFVGKLGDDGPNDAVAGSILALARALDLATVAEGIETAEQLTWLRQRGCPVGQGYLLSRPASATARDAMPKQVALDSL